jgi:hypothetical protein
MLVSQALTPMSDSLDQLFQAPLAEFTAVRNALAKSAGADGADIRRIEKPSAAAWAVNQVYWRYRKAWDKLVRASERVRAANAEILKGKRVELEPLELAHRAAIRDAQEHARAALVAAADAATDATMKAVQDTLQALPVAGPPGRLTRPLGFVGFDSLSGLLSGASVKRRAADIISFAPPRPSKPSAEEREEEARQEAQRAKAEAAERERRRKALQAKQKGVEERLRKARLKAGELAAELDSATADVKGLERELDGIRIELTKVQ